MTNKIVVQSDDDWGGEDTTQKVLQDSISEKDRLNFAKNILKGIMYLLIFATLIQIIPETLIALAPADENRDHTQLRQQLKVIFEFFKTVLPPIATLVIGYYFAQNQKPE